ncbi:MAG: permease [Halanaerobiales bacterium]|nr:permease [Halanaerobiales bacterium]
MLQWFADFVVYNLFNIAEGSKLGDAINFFIYDSLKIIILLSFMIFVISILRSFFPPERASQLLSGKKLFVGNVMASVLGVISPFCSCSTVPIFIGFVESGIPLGVTFSFLITSPIVNEIALVMLFTLFGWKIATLYLISGMLVGIVGGIIIGNLKLEKEVEEYVYEIKMGERHIEKMTWQQRFVFAKDAVVDIVKRIWIYVLIGIGIGALIHGYAPAELLSRYAGENNPFAIFVAVVLGIPLYSNAVGTIPIIQALIGKGVGVGTALSFMMAVVALSLPEMIILRKVIKPKLIGIFVAIVGVSIICVGYLFNIIL